MHQLEGHNSNPQKHDQSKAFSLPLTLITCEPEQKKERDET
jgi:hypothetical protein